MFRKKKSKKPAISQQGVGAPPGASSSNGAGAKGGGVTSSTPQSRRSLHRMRSKSAPPSTSRRDEHHELIEDHYRVDHEAHVVLPGVPKYDDDWARDCHDFFNLIALVPVCVLNAMNWNFDLLAAYCGLAGGGGGGGPDGKGGGGGGGGGGSSGATLSIATAWTGEWFLPFFQITALYFTIDLFWVALVPKCVKSPSTIVQHHIATICYIMIPYYYPFVRWLMGACMSVEVNTWCLIARRVFNKQGLPPWILNLPLGVSIRIKLISILFYASWIFIRIMLYPVIWVVLFGMWKEYSVEVATGWNVLAIALPLHTVFCALNIKWTVDLLLSKIRYWRKGGKENIDKGL
mmetsp:Transcript_29021/g.68029  ORF Transcript_29021/g.68029 Transcript_29021/m.68029 type:complete len:347 (-) Transcript_29021:153-1193(-)